MIEVGDYVEYCHPSFPDYHGSTGRVIGIGDRRSFIIFWETGRLSKEEIYNKEKIRFSLATIRRIETQYDPLQAGDTEDDI